MARRIDAFLSLFHSSLDDTVFVGAFTSSVLFMGNDGFVSHMLDEEDVNDSLIMI